MTEAPSRFSVHTLFEKLRASRQLLDLIDAAHIIKETSTKLSRSAAGIHGDMIPDNITIDVITGEIRLVGFGNLKVDDSIHAPVNKLRYLSPERARGESATTATDIFSLGLIFWRLVYGRDLISLASQPEILERLKTFTTPAFPATPQVPSEIVSLLGGMINPVATQRLSARQVQEQLASLIARRDPKSSPSSCNLRLVTLIRKITHDPLSGILTGDKNIDGAIPDYEKPPLRWKIPALIFALIVGGVTQRYYTTFKTKGASSVSSAVQTDLKLLMNKSKTALQQIGNDTPAPPKPAKDLAPGAKNEEKVAEIIPFRIDSTPRGAQVYIDQKATTYYTPAVLEVSAQTSLLITLKRRGYKDCAALIAARLGLFFCTLEK